MFDYLHIDGIVNVWIPAGLSVANFAMRDTGVRLAFPGLWLGGEEHVYEVEPYLAVEHHAP